MLFPGCLQFSKWSYNILEQIENVYFTQVDEFLYKIVSPFEKDLQAFKNFRNIAQSYVQ